MTTYNFIFFPEYELELVGKRPAAARADARAEQADKPRFTAPVPLCGEVTARPRLKTNISIAKCS